MQQCRLKVAIVCLCLIGNSIVLADTFGVGENSFTIDFVRVGSAGNPDDTTGNPNPVGSVDYVFRMAKLEVSEGMINKANALGGLGIVHRNYGADKPATTISWFEAAKFVNWLNTSTGNPPAYHQNQFGGFVSWLPGEPGYDPNNGFRNKNARYVLPTTDEWYKAAYYDPIRGVYYDYPTGSDTPPDGVDFAGDTEYEALFCEGSCPASNTIYDVGKLSPFGTANQGGSVFEHEETEYDLVNDKIFDFHGVRGGAIAYGLAPLKSTSRSTTSRSGAGDGHDHLGFRVAMRVDPVPALIGDYSDNGAIDAADYTIWRDSFGASFLPNRSPSASGPVGQSDYNVWKSRFMATSASSSASVVPEPAAQLLALLGGLLLSAVRNTPLCARSPERPLPPNSCRTLLPWC